MEYEVPISTKIEFIANCLLFILALYLGNDVIGVGSLIIFVIISSEIEIIEAIYRAGKEK